MGKPDLHRHHYINIVSNNLWVSVLNKMLEIPTDIEYLHSFVVHKCVHIEGLVIKKNISIYKILFIVVLIEIDTLAHKEVFISVISELFGIFIK
jgi:hypothetical protein